MTTEPSLSFYKEAAGSSFQVIGTEPPLELELVEVEDKGITSGYEQFTLLFRGPLQPFIPQQTLQLRTQTVDVAIFIVPVAQDAEGTRYEAVFSRLAQD
ncbi:DUF6916 family protein [Paenibacillus radicis (ex Gao et al. 2016)]|nr:hypothetical protein [Paenibacillus radicis (ex Gao et al. 2016)]